MKVVAITAMICLVLFMLLTGCDSQNELERKTLAESNDVKRKELQEYSDSKFNFYVSYPKNWRSEIEKTLESTSTNEASPDGGIRIYMNESKDNFIYAYGCVSDIGIPEQGFEKETIKRDGEEDLILLIKEVGGNIEAHCNYDKFHAVSMRLNKDIFENKKLVIYDILRSYRIFE
jgi:hypothetical protein